MNVPNTFKRGQVEWALWRFFTLGKRTSDKPPQKFRTRIKRLLELDRAGTGSADAYAFLDSDPEGQGVDAEYTPLNAFCLCLAMDMLDAGYKQAEVVFLLQHIRRQLAPQFRRIQASPPAIRQKVAAADRPGCPAYEERGVRWADCRVFMVLEKIELTEVLPVASTGKRIRDPAFLQPTFCRGVAALGRELHHMNFQYRKALVMEVASPAAAIDELLREAPEIKRGRK